MEANEVRKIGVLGAGVMGHGIAEVAALAGCEVSLYDITPELAQGGVEKVRWSLSKFVERKSISKEKADEVLARISGTSSLDAAVGNAEVVIEAAPEDVSVKRELFEKVDGLAPPGSLFASNTSTLPISEIASAVKRKGSFVGMHFFNPPPLMPLLEVTRAESTDDASFQLACALGLRFGKEVVVCRKDVPGFLVNRVLGPILNEAAWTVGRGEGTVESVDSMATYGVGLPMGLFELADYSGIDTIYKAGTAVAFRDPTNVLVAPLFKQKFEERKFGRKSGEGFYQYNGSKWDRPPISRDAGASLDPLTVFAPGVNAASWLIRNEVCTRSDLDKAVKLGLGFPDGILRMADRWGLQRVVDVLRRKEKAFGPFYAPDPLLLKMVSAGEAGERSGKGFYEYAETTSTLKEVAVKKDGAVGWILLSRSHRLNLLTQGLVEELVASMKGLEADPEVRVVVIRGDGDKAFSAGADLTSFDITSPAKAFAITRSWFESFAVAERLHKPVIAAINGVALGGGCELALACDFRLASEDAKIGLTETNLGLIPGAGGTQRLARLVGLPRAKEMVFLGQRLDASEALRIGLVDRVFKKDEFDSEVSKFAAALSRRPPLALWFAKQAFNFSAETPADIGQLFEAMGFGLLLSTQDASEGVSALFQKREPEFKGE